MNTTQRWLLCYDIADPDRLAVIGRYMGRRAERVQYSVYRLRAGPRDLAALLADVALLMDPEADDVRCYPLAARALWRTLGNPLLGDDLTLAGPDLADVAPRKRPPLHDSAVRVPGRPSLPGVVWSA